MGWLTLIKQALDKADPRLKYLSGGFVGILIIALIVYFVYTPSQGKKEKVKTVDVVKVMRTNLTREVTLSAELQPYSKTTLYAKLAGYLKTINVDIGDRVKKNQILAILDIPEIVDDLAKNKAILDEAWLEYDRIAKVSQKRPGLVAQEDVDKSKATYEVAKANYEHTKTLVDYATIVAPFDGIIINRFVDEGALIQAGTSSSKQAMPVVEVANDTKLRLIFPVPESMVPSIKIGSPVSVVIQATGKTIKGIIARMTGKVDHDTRTMETEVDLDNKDGEIRPGMYAHVTFSPTHVENVLVLPVQAVARGQKPNVWLVNQTEKLENRLVVLGLQTPERVEIKSGVNEGDRIVYGNLGSMVAGIAVDPHPIEPPKVSVNE